MENMRMSPDRDDANGSRCQKLSLGKVPRSPKNPNALKPRKDVQFRSGGKTSSSRKEPIPLKPLKDVNFRSADKRDLDEEYEEMLDKLFPRWVDLEGDSDDEDAVVVASVDKRALDEAIERKEEVDELFFRSSEALRKKAHGYATAAISYMRKKGRNLELVKPCLFSSGLMAIGVRTHFNFKAKRADDPSAPVETYFGQLRVCSASSMVVECCVSLGASDSLPYKRDNRGCHYCRGIVHHPEGGCEGIIWGRVTRCPMMEKRGSPPMEKPGSPPMKKRVIT
ncbi:uncharacterized protein LOC141617466 isoform X2 [Silene latifolia]|uniref:uncharacterized protein LOC141617466 isoform X2 n=1 Tax=Silene latifolia TaxID=37657 RepID=UPI003D77FAB3